MKYRKIVVTAPWEFEIVSEVFTGSIQDPNEIIVKNLFSHISAGTEMACVSGIEDWFAIPGVPGYTAVGKVLEKGEGVSHLEVGDTVFTYGPHAGLFKIDCTDRWHGVCVKVPEGLDPAKASFTHMGGIAMTAIRKANIELGDCVAVSGLGAIGNLAAQFALLQGARVMGIDINNRRLEIARQSGISNVVNSAESSLEEAIDEFTGGEKVTTWIDASGVSGVVNEAINYTAPAGELVLLGTPRASHETDITPLLRKVHLEGIRLTGALEFLSPTHRDDFEKHSIERNSRIIMDLLNKGKVVVDPFFSHLLDPARAEEAYKGLRDNPDEFIGVVFDWTGASLQ